jgi:hypothetical protein
MNKEYIHNLYKAIARLKSIGQNRGTWEPPQTFNKEVLRVCSCCIEFADTGEWPSGPECNQPSVDFDAHCVKRINGTPGYGTFNYTQANNEVGDTVEDLLYMLDHFGEPFYPASCLTDVNCSWEGGDHWPYWQDPEPCCLPEGNCANTTPLVCNLHGGNTGGSSSCEATGSCCFQSGDCKVITECECEKLEGNSWNEGGNCGQGGGNNPCNPSIAPPQKT